MTVNVPIEEERMEDLTEMCVTWAPRRFALCELSDDPEQSDAPGIFVWGAECDGGAVLFGPDGRPFGLFSSAERAQRTFSRIGDLRLVWIDAAPEPAGPGQETDPGPDM